MSISKPQDNRKGREKDDDRKQIAVKTKISDLREKYRSVIL